MIALRQAKFADAAMLLEWRNDPESLENSLSTDAVPTDRHLGWLREVLADPERQLFIAELDGVPVGTGRLDYFEVGAEVNLTVSPAFRWRGLGGQIIDALIERALARSAGTLVAVVRGANAGSIRAFLSAGFEARGILMFDRKLP